jgi:hypothetical protein
MYSGLMARGARARGPGPNPYPNAAADWIATTCIQLRSQDAWLQDPDLAAWVERSRLNATRGIRDHLAEPRMSSAVTRLLTNIKPGMAKLETFLAGTRTPAP